MIGRFSCALKHSSGEGLSGEFAGYGAVRLAVVRVTPFYGWRPVWESEGPLWTADTNGDGWLWDGLSYRDNAGVYQPFGTPRHGGVPSDLSGYPPGFAQGGPAPAFMGKSIAQGVPGETGSGRVFVTSHSTGRAR